MSQTAEIFEMGPRDGLQNEKRLIPAADKIALVDLLSGAGFRRIEVTSFVSPKWVPQMADAAEVMAGIARRAGVSYAVLTPNLKGYEGARAARADEVAIFASASEGFSKANLNATIAESLERFVPVAGAARVDGVKMRGYVSVVTDCPYDGPTPPENVARVAARLRDMGCYEISLGDTIGQGRPESVDAMLGAVLNELPPEKLAGHFHDTAGRALENIDASLARGL
ncbi:MAG: hydroxymethylglutaryl-CoA lyase, partial [Paracoccus sp. (in: a-proteobacteria)]|nr:hydroxymethylglutaryl-CoA lyase [Paracoccus sp. (in: a-proteobacteria)]